jgi:hypothetical protein
MEMGLQNHCLVMDVSPGQTILAFGRHVTISSSSASFVLLLSTPHSPFHGFDVAACVGLLLQSTRSVPVQ